MWTISFDNKAEIAYFYQHLIIFAIGSILEIWAHIRNRNYYFY